MNAEPTLPADDEPRDADAPADLPLFGPLGAALASIKKNIEKRNAAKGKAPPAKAPRGDANKISARTTRTAAKK